MKANHPLLFAAVLLLGSCVAPPAPAPPPPPPPKPAPVAAPAPAPIPIAPVKVAPDWRDRPLTAGTWTWLSREGRSIARFGSPSYANFAVECDPAARQVTLRSSVLNIAYVTVQTTSLLRTLPVTLDETAIPVTSVVRLDARDPLLDAMAFSRGRFMVEETQTSLYLPAWTELSRVVEDCR